MMMSSSLLSILEKVDDNEDAEDENMDISSVTDEWQVLLSLARPFDPDFFHFFIWLALLRTEPPNFLIPDNFPFPPDEEPSGATALSFALPARSES
eukprot:CAMPEP_0181046172 /NCGR_PEP_ID=MMETSP1070-20121207/14203_1 /TAXON_ID=265543 /ORGANISM="Minutocellus polymorphus, Strain NH13" /LENGTH=95 /DNA_ID=CAMNT_0023124757 /DNA_START=294 /DNA_END=581 /DNA_ORIENTATION=-